MVLEKAVDVQPGVKAQQAPDLFFTQVPRLIPLQGQLFQYMMWNVLPRQHAHNVVRQMNGNIHTSKPHAVAALTMPFPCQRGYRNRAQRSTRLTRQALSDKVVCRGRSQEVSQPPVQGSVYASQEDTSPGSHTAATVVVTS